MNEPLQTEISITVGEEYLYYVTALSNLVRGYDKYRRIYDKGKIPESTFPDKFFLLRREELAVGITKAGHLLSKTGLPGDRLIAVETRAYTQELRPNTRTGLGRYVERGHVTVEAVHFIEEPDVLRRISMEEACALSHRMHAPSQSSYETLSPRSVSILPVARACQAHCPFCFSRASVSEDTLPIPLDWCRVGEVLRAARDRGAQRAVITGGGEPSLLRDGDLQRLIREAAACFSKVVLISNGHTWARKRDDARAAAL